MPCSITDGPQYEEDGWHPSEPDTDDRDGAGCLLGPRVENWSRNVNAAREWKDRLLARAAGVVEPDLRNDEQRKRGGRLCGHLFILRYAMKLRNRREI